MVSGDILINFLNHLCKSNLKPTEVFESSLLIIWDSFDIGFKFHIFVKNDVKNCLFGLTNESSIPEIYLNYCSLDFGPLYPLPPPLQ